MPLYNIGILATFSVPPRIQGCAQTFFGTKFQQTFLSVQFSIFVFQKIRDYLWNINLHNMRNLRSTIFVFFWKPYWNSLSQYRHLAGRNGHLQYKHLAGRDGHLQYRHLAGRDGYHTVQTPSWQRWASIVQTPSWERWASIVQTPSWYRWAFIV